MPKPTNGISIYDYNNLSSYLKRLSIEGQIDFRYMHDIVNTKISMFEYKGLPEDITSEILETALCFNNNLCFYNSPTMGVVLCRWLPLGEYSIYWKPKKVQLIALNGLSIANEVPYSDIVLVKDNKMDIIPFIFINEYISKMVEMENTLIKNVQLLKLPAVFTGNKQMVSTFNSLMKKVLDIDAFALTDKTVIEEFKQFNIEFPVSPEEILSLYKNYKNMCLESIGIYGIETQKRERLLVKEVQSQTEYIDFMYQMCLNERMRFINECNSKFNTNINIIEVYKQFREDEISLIAKEEKEVSRAVESGDINDD